MSDAPVSIGVDIGSRMTKIVWLRDGAIADAKVFETGFEPLAGVHNALQGAEARAMVATGYGRRLARVHLDCSVITEISACARGAKHVAPDADSVIDIGGQDTKAIELSDDGLFGRFEMNDRCAAGTGRFLEVMAVALGFTLDEFARAAMEADEPVQVNATCTVFAESEVISLIASGQDRRRIALGLHAAVARRVAALASRITTGEHVLFVGGVANNPCVTACLQQELAGRVVVPDRPELVVALGAALVGADEFRR